MSLRALLVAGAVVALLAAARSRRRSADVAPMLVLALVVALAVYHSAQARIHSAYGLPRVPSTLDPPPAGYRAVANRALAHEALAHIPQGAAYAIVAVRRTPGEFWLRYVLAPRFRVDPASARWVLVLGGTPVQAGLHPVRTWRAGPDWLVRT